MASVHNALTRGPWGRALKNALGDTKGEGGLERYGETMQPVIDLWSMPEWAYLRGEMLWSISLTKGADAANNGVVGVMLPTASKLIVTVDGISGRNSVANGNLVLSGLDRAGIAALAGFALGNPPFFRDSRIATPQLSTNGFTQQAPVETFTALNGVLLVNGTMENIVYPTADNRQFQSVPLVIKPGNGVLVQGVAVNQQIVVTFFGRVRMALPGELKS